MKAIKRSVKHIGIFVLLIIFSGITITANAGFRNGANMVVQFKGEGKALEVIPHKIAALLPATPIACLKMPMINPSTGWQIGNGYDCVIEMNFDPTSGGGPVRTAYVLDFFGRRGLLVTDSHITVQLNEWDPQSAIDLGDGNVYPVTHLISDMPVAPEQNIYAGTRRFAKATGRVRVSGGNNLERLGEGIIVFDYLIVVVFD